MVGVQPLRIGVALFGGCAGWGSLVGIFLLLCLFSLRRFRFGFQVFQRLEYAVDLILGEHKYDILIGTQIVAKGLHFPNVSVVGVINADILLNFPDFNKNFLRRYKKEKFML